MANTISLSFKYRSIFLQLNFNIVFIFHLPKGVVTGLQAPMMSISHRFNYLSNMVVCLKCAKGVHFEQR